MDSDEPAELSNLLDEDRREALLRRWPIRYGEDLKALQANEEGHRRGHHDPRTPRGQLPRYGAVSSRP